MGAGAASDTQSWKIVLCGAGVGDMKRAMLAHPAIPWLIKTDLGAANGHGTKMSPRYRHVPLAQSQHHIVNSTNPGGALDDGVEDRLYVRGRTANNAKHLGCCGLMLQCLAQFCVTLLDLLEQPHILDGDYRLIGEGFQESDLFVGEWTDFYSANDNCSDRYAFSQQRRNEHGSIAGCLLSRS